MSVNTSGNNTMPKLTLDQTTLNVAFGGGEQKSLTRSRAGIIGWLFGQNVGICLDYKDATGKVHKAEWVYIKKSAMNDYITSHNLSATVQGGHLGRAFVSSIVKGYRDAKATTMEKLPENAHPKDAVLSSRGDSYVLTDSDVKRLKDFLTRFNLKLPSEYEEGVIIEGNDDKKKFLDKLREENKISEKDWKKIYAQIGDYLEYVETGGDAIRDISKEPDSPLAVHDVESSSVEKTEMTTEDKRIEPSFDENQIQFKKIAYKVGMWNFLQRLIGGTDLVQMYNEGKNWAASGSPADISRDFKNENSHVCHQIFSLFRYPAQNLVERNPSDSSERTAGSAKVDQARRKILEVVNALPKETKRVIGNFLRSTKENIQEDAELDTAELRKQNLETFIQNIRQEK